MPEPGQADIDIEELEALLDRIEERRLEADDYPLIMDYIRSMTWLSKQLENQTLTLRRLRKLFGVGAKTEQTGSLPKDPEAEDSSKPDDDKDAQQKADKDKLKEKKRKKRKSRRNSAKDFKSAIISKISHATLKIGSRCPECNSGNLRLIEPGRLLRIVGQPWLQAHIYEQERFRCNTCGKTFTARLPADIAKAPKIDNAAKTIVCLLKYRGGFPFYRQESLQAMLETPVSDSVLWEMTNDVSKCLAPVHEVLIKQAAEGDCLHNDDTRARILDLIQENKSRDPDKERTGIFTSAILSRLGNREIALFFTGRQHAGENLSDVLDARPGESPPPIQMCDASSNNVPKSHETHEANCHAHLRRKFYEIAEVWPKFVLPIILFLNTLFRVDRETKERGMSDDERLKWHQTHSSSAINNLKAHCDDLIKSKKTEPNSNLGKAIAYMNNHWDAFTLFLRLPGVPIDNNADERLIKRAVLNRKNGLFFKTAYGAWVGDVLLSTIETCQLNAVNPYKYLVAIQDHSEDVQKDPEKWLPWNYTESISSKNQESLGGLSPLAEAPLQSVVG